MIDRSFVLRIRAVIAMTTVCLLVTSGLLARHHEADVSHFTDARTGITSHAVGADCHDSELVSHIHALPGDRHADACGLTAAVHQPITFAQPVPLVGQLAIVERATAPPVAQHAQSPLLLAAPKTSPPSFV